MLDGAAGENLMTMRITGGMHRGRRLRSSKGPGLRPTSDRVRGAVFSIIGDAALTDALVLDLFAGTGILGIEALSRGAASAHFIEANGRRCEDIRRSVEEISLKEQCSVFRGRVEGILPTLEGAYDLVFADPPYDLDVWDKVMGLLDSRCLVRENGLVVAEHRHSTAMADAYGRLERTTSRRYGDTTVSIYIAGERNG